MTVSTDAGKTGLFDPSNVAITGGNVGNTPVKPIRTIGAIGDSFTDLNVSTSTGKNYNIRGYLAHASAISQARMMIGSLAGYSGYTAAQVLAQLPAFLATCSDSVVVFFAGANDITAADASLQTPAQLYATLQSAYDLIRAAGKVPVAATILPRTTAVSAAQVALRNNVNALLRAEQAAGRLLLADWANVYEDASGTLPTVISYDGVHPYMGAEMMGQVLWNAVQQIYPSANLDVVANYGDASNLLTNGTVSGTTGAIAGTASGTVATGWTANGNASMASAVCSKVASTDVDDQNEWQQVVCTAGAGGVGAFAFQQSVTLTAGQNVRCSAQVEVDVTDAVSLVAFDIRLTSFPSSTSAAHLPTVDTTKTYRATPATRRRTLVTPVWTIPAGHTSATFYVDLQVAASKSVTLRFRRAKVVLMS